MGDSWSNSGFSSLAAKDAAFCSKFTAGTALPNGVPSGGYASWASGAQAIYPAISAAAAFAAMAASTPQMSPEFCASVAPLVVDSAHFDHANFLTDRGVALIYSWLFTAKGVNDYLAYPGFAPSPLWKGGTINRLLNAGATIGMDGRTLTYSFYGAQAGSGPCDGDYNALVVESASAVAVALQEISSAAPASPTAASGSPAEPPPACVPIVVLRSVTVTLASALGGRVVVDASGAPVSVCPEALTRSC